MRYGSRVAVIIPALNEEDSIGAVLEAIPEWVDGVVVSDNGSRDRTAGIARAHGATVVSEPRRGYGSACLAALATVKSRGIVHTPDIVVFLDGDLSDYPERMSHLVDPIVANEVDLVIGSRVLGAHEPGALTPQARFGNWLATRLIHLFWKVAYTDLGPFRAIRYSSLLALHMADPDYGWTVEMQIKAARLSLRIKEVPVDYRKRIGESKVSGTIRGVVGAGYKILSTILLAAVSSQRAEPAAPSQKRCLVVFTRYPEPGKTKTRLIPALGPEGAAELQREMTEFALATAREFRRCFDCDIEVRFEGGGPEAMADWLGAGLNYVSQGPGDLGERMAGAMCAAFDGGASEVVIIGTDCPLITVYLLQEAFSAVRESDLVIGPAVDGGYYLIGLSGRVRDRALPRVFQGHAWGAETVLSATLATARESGLRVRALPELHDVDRAEDIEVWQTVKASLAAQQGAPQISVIIPTLNEQECLRKTLRAVKGAYGVELLVTDGGSTDETRSIAISCGVRFIQSEPGRAKQANFAARQAQGDILFFLHADTTPPSGWETYVRDTLKDDAVVAGAFEFSTDFASRWMRFFERITNLRARWFQLPYGDQGLFLRKKTFYEVGAYPDYPIMDDFEIVRRLSRLGRIVVVPQPAITAGRRWRRIGVWCTMWINQICIAGYLLGFPLSTIASWYHRGKRIQ